MKIDSSRPRPGASSLSCVIGLGQTEFETRLRPGRILTEPPDGPKHAARLVGDEELASSRSAYFETPRKGRSGTHQSSARDRYEWARMECGAPVTGRSPYSPCSTFTWARAGVSAPLHGQV